MVRRLYAARVQDPLETRLTWDALPDFAQMRDMDRAAARLAQAVQRHERIVIAGDYDADGATATAVLVKAIRLWGGTVDFVVPDRQQEGYGLTPPLAERVLADHPCSLLITVDNGIASHAGIALLNQHKVTTLVTDHHLPPEGALPPAYAVVDPKRADETTATAHLAGVGVALGLAIVTRDHLLRAHWERKVPSAVTSLTGLLDLVALGTIADVVPLDRVNRLLVDQGLRYIREGLGCPGIRALAQCAQRSFARLQSEDLAFSLGPRLNAAGRLADMRTGIHCLLASTSDEAMALAQSLQDLNTERRSLENQMRLDAERYLGNLLTDSAEKPFGIVLADPSWHEGVVGLVAGRIKDRLQRPVIACAPGVDGVWKGSARSIPGIHIRDVLVRIDKDHPGLLQRFGGHAAAAGLSLAAHRISDLRRVFAQAVRSEASSPEVFVQEPLTDGTLSGADLTLETAQAIQNAGPWGAGFPPPLFEGDFEVLTIDPLKDGLHARLTVRPLGEDGSPVLTAMAFNLGQRLLWTPTLGAHRFHYGLGVNTFRDQSTPQILIDAVVPPHAPGDDPDTESRLRV